jgi:REP element-mobilizing transposase RayT
MPLAYFITFTTYGTWLPGTAKGKGSVDHDHNEYGTEFVQPDPAFEIQARSAMTQPPYTLDAPRRETVRDAIVRLSREKSWHLLAAHVRTNHVHVVITAGRDPGRLMADLKSRASRELTRAGFEDANRIRWTRHGSTRHLFKTEEVEQKIRYTLDEQGAQMAVFDGRKEPRTK